MTARLHHVGRQIVHVDVALVEGDEARRGVERRQALDHVVERGIEPAPFRFQPLLRLAVLPGDLPDDQEQDQGDHRRRQRCRDDEEAGLLAPVGERGGNRVGRDHHARVMSERGCRSQPVRLVDRALYPQRLLGAALPDLLQQRRLREILADQVVDPRIARQQGAVGMKHRDGGAGSERHGSKEFFVIDRVDTPRHHAEEDAVFASQSMGDDGIQIAVEIAANRLGQNGRRSRIELEALEIAPLGNVEARRRQRPRPVDHVAVGIEDGDVAEIGQDARLGPQDLVRFGASDMFPEVLLRGDTGNLQPGDHVVGERVGVLELLVEVTGKQEDGILQLAFAVAKRAFAEFSGHHDGAGENRRDQQAAAKGQPQHRPPDGRGKMPAGGCGSGAHAVQMVKQTAHFPLLSGTCIRWANAKSG